MVSESVRTPIFDQLHGVLIRLMLCALLVMSCLYVLWPADVIGPRSDTAITGDVLNPATLMLGQSAIAAEPAATDILDAKATRASHPVAPAKTLPVLN